MRKLNISVAKQYQDKNTNQLKTKWINIGSMVIQDDGKVFGEIEALPVGATELKFNCFDRDEQPRQQPDYSSPQGYGGQQPEQPMYAYVDANGNPITQQQWHQQNQGRR